VTRRRNTHGIGHQDHFISSRHQLLDKDGAAQVISRLAIICQEVDLVLAFPSGVNIILDADVGT